MRRQLYILLMTLWFIPAAQADTHLQDPVSRKELVYYHHSLKENANALNPFEDLELMIPVFKNNKKCSESIEKYILQLLREPAYKQRLKEHALRSIAYFIDYSEYAQELGTYDRQKLMDQNIVLDDLDAYIMAYYNGLVCIRIESHYSINRSYGDMKKDVTMFQQVFMDVNTGKIKKLQDLCPAPLRKKFSAYLDKQLSAVIIALSAKEEARKKYEEEPDEYGIPFKPKKPAFSPAKINYSDLVLDINAMNFVVHENSANTEQTGGAPFILTVNEDSLNHFLPWTANPLKGTIDERLPAQKVNKNLFAYRNEYMFLYDEYLISWFESKLDSREIIVYFRQSSSDTTFLPNTHLKYNPDHTLAELNTNYDHESKPGLFKTYVYRDGRLDRVVQTNDKQTNKTIATYTYNKKGFVTGFIDQDDYERTDHSYAYNGLSVNDCMTGEDGNKCYTSVFDPEGNLLTRAETGTKTSYPNVYRNGRLMARGDDALFTYNENGQIESMERDRGRYYTKYLYDDKKRISHILYYDNKELANKTTVEYDAKDHITLVTRTTYSYSKLQSEVQFRMVYR